MAGKAATAQRVSFAARMLLQGHSASRVVSDLAVREGISLRSARRYVAKGYQQLVDDLEDSGIDRAQVTAQLVHLLQEAMARALNSNHISAMVGAARELRELLQIGRSPTRPKARPHA